MFESKGSTQAVLNISKVSSSTWYSSKKEKKSDKREFNKGRPKTITCQKLDGSVVHDEEVVRYIEKYREQDFFKNAGGYRKIAIYLKRDYNLKINKKKVYRLMNESKLLLERRNKLKSVLKKNKMSSNHVINRPFQLWELDIKYGYLMEESKFFFLMPIIDVYLRYVVGYHIGLSCLGSDLTRTLKMALERMNVLGNTNLLIRSDNGPQMRSHSFMNFFDERKDQIVQEFIPCNTPNKNAHVESFNSIVELEFFKVLNFKDYAEAYQKTNEFIVHYNTRRIHGSLNMKTPKECLDEYLLGGQLKLKEIYL